MSDDLTPEEFEEDWEEDEKRTLAHVYATLYTAGYRKAKQGQPGCRVLYYGGLIFVSFDDPANTCDSQKRLAAVKNYQEALKKKGIDLKLFDHDPSDPYLCG